MEATTKGRTENSRRPALTGRFFSFKVPRMSIVSIFNPVATQKTAFAKAVVNDPSAMRQKVSFALSKIDNLGTLSSNSSSVARDITLLNRFVAGTAQPANRQEARVIPSAVRSIIKDLKLQEQASRVNHTVPMMDTRAATAILQQLLRNR